jgi:elongation factor P
LDYSSENVIMSYTAADLRKGLKIELEGIPYEVNEFEFVKPGKGQAMYKCASRTCCSAPPWTRPSAPSTRSTSNIESKPWPSLQGRRQVRLLDNKTYEQVELHEGVVGDQRFSCSKTSNAKCFSSTTAP